MARYLDLHGQGYPQTRDGIEDGEAPPHHNTGVSSLLVKKLELRLAKRHMNGSCSTYHATDLAIHTYDLRTVLTIGSTHRSPNRGMYQSR